MDLNNIESPFSFELGELELFPLPSLSPDIPVPHLPSNIISPLVNNKAPTRPRKPPRANTSNDIIIIGDESHTDNEHKKKKIIHREVERQRRLAMSSLYSTLRSLLPLQYLMGKRSICDHMHETVKYIQHMQSKIEQLSDKRDELKKLAIKNLIVGTVETLNSTERDSVRVRQKNGPGGIQVILDTATQHRLSVFSILQALTVEGFEITTCISIKVNERFFHTIECQIVVNDGRYRSIDVSELQHKLMNLKYFPLDH